LSWISGHTERDFRKRRKWRNFDSKVLTTRKSEIMQTKLDLKLFFQCFCVKEFYLKN
jgi:phosphopantetheinyl transferase